MTRLLLILSCLIVSAAALAQTTVYRYVDENGNVVYTNEPREGAETIKVPEPNVAQPPPDMPDVKAEQASETEESGPVYRRFEIISPAKDEVIWNTGTRDLEVRLAIEPMLIPLHRIEVSAAGKNARGFSLSYRLEDINRGTHQVSARIIDDNGNVVQEAEGHEFHVRQHSIATPP